MRYAQIRSMDVSNGEGVRVSLFVQGCDFHCKDCFNQSTWDWNGGKAFTKETLNKLLELCSKSYIKGLSILGGEPLNPINIDGVTRIAKVFKSAFPQKDLWIWTGYLIDTIPNKEILKYADYIVDGRFEDDKKDFKLKYRGSSNQRIWKKENDQWLNISNQF